MAPAANTGLTVTKSVIENWLEWAKAKSVTL
jgi:hypothetical protein